MRTVQLDISGMVSKRIYKATGFVIVERKTLLVSPTLSSAASRQKYHEDQTGF